MKIVAYDIVAHNADGTPIIITNDLSKARIDLRNRSFVFQGNGIVCTLNLSDVIAFHITDSYGEFAAGKTFGRIMLTSLSGISGSGILDLSLRGVEIENNFKAVLTWNNASWVHLFMTAEECDSFLHFIPNASGEEELFRYFQNFFELCERKENDGERNFGETIDEIAKEKVEVTTLTALIENGANFTEREIAREKVAAANHSLFDNYRELLFLSKLFNKKVPNFDEIPDSFKVSNIIEAPNADKGSHADKSIKSQERNRYFDLSFSNFSLKNKKVIYSGIAIWIFLFFFTFYMDFNFAKIQKQNPPEENSTSLSTDLEGNNSQIEAVPDENAIAALEANRIYKIISKKANVRSLANPNSDIVGELSFLSKVEISEVSEIFDSANETNQEWYFIKDQQSGTTGWVNASLISYKTIEMPIDEMAIGNISETHPSFACNKNNTRIETIICESDVVSSFDSELSVTFKAKLKKMDEPQKQEALSKQRSNLERRETCEDADCLKNWYPQTQMWVDSL